MLSNLVNQTLPTLPEQTSYNPPPTLSTEHSVASQVTLAVTGSTDANNTSTEFTVTCEAGYTAALVLSSDNTHIELTVSGPSSALADTYYYKVDQNKNTQLRDWSLRFVNMVNNERKGKWTFTKGKGDVIHPNN